VATSPSQLGLFGEQVRYLQLAVATSQYSLERHVSVIDELVPLELHVRTELPSQYTAFGAQPCPGMTQAFPEQALPLCVQSVELVTRRPSTEHWTSVFELHSVAPAVHTQLSQLAVPAVVTQV